MAEYGETARDEKKMRDYAEQVFNSFGELHARDARILNISRLRAIPPNTIEGLDVKNVQTGRALSIPAQFVAFADAPKVTVIPKDNSEEEDGRTSKIEQFLAGYPHAFRYSIMHPFDAYLWNYAERGRGILLLTFDQYKAVEGKFPFLPLALDPSCCAFHFGAEEMLCAVIREEKEAAALWNDLYARYETVAENLKDGAKMEWSIPASLKEYADKDPLRKLECLTLYTKDMHYYWIGDDFVWCREHLMGEVPVTVQFCTATPSDEPGEWGYGLLYAAMGMLVNQQVMWDKFATGFGLYFFPQAKVKYKDGTVAIKQITPGFKDDQVEEIVEFFPQLDYQSVQLMFQQYEEAIARVSIPDNVASGKAEGSSGYQENLLQATPLRRMEKLVGKAGEGLARHYGLLLDRISYFATEQMAREFGAKDKEKYLKSFSTVSAPQKNPTSKKLARTVLTKADVDGYTEVEVVLMPEARQDENANAQRAGLLKEMMPQEYIDKEVLKVRNPDQVAQWRKDEEAKQNPEWAKFLINDAINARLELDDKLYERWVETKATELKPEWLALFKELLAQGFRPLDAWGILGQLLKNPDAQLPQAQDPNAQQPQMTPDMMGQGQGMMNEAGGLTPDIQGIPPGMMPPAEMGQVPPNPEQAAMQGSFALGG